MSINELVLLIIIGLVAGFVGGALGLGGGIIIVPALVFIMGFSQHQAQGTSLLVLLLPVGIFAVIHYAKNNYIDYKFAAVLILATVLGSYVGSVVSTHLPAKTLKTIFGVFMLLVSLKMIFNK